jgi:hypothetical protein
MTQTRKTKSADIGGTGGGGASLTAEQARLLEASCGRAPWKMWGPYLSERQWGTVREDYSLNGDAWNYFTHDQARSRAYRWGEDGLAGICDDQELLCFALALWNGRDPILKERLFGLTNSEGNHGEDVKEYYYYLDSTPTHSYLKYLYKYPQAAYPYDDLIATNRSRNRSDFEYELLDTGVFDQNRYFDVFVEYAKAAPEDILIEITAHNRGPDPAELHLLPTLWFRNTWSWGDEAQRPLMAESGPGLIAAAHPLMGSRTLVCEDAPPLLFTENETNTERLYSQPNRTPFVKDAFDSCLVQGRAEAVNPARQGTKAAAHYRMTVPAGGSSRVRLRLRDTAASGDAFKDFEATLEARQREADEFYGTVIPQKLSQDQKLVMRQAMAGMLWSKQFYNYDVERWLEERGIDPVRPTRHAPRNEQWRHLENAHIISMPDKWEYPWYAAWDLAFHVLALVLVDEDFGKEQLELILGHEYLHPNGQIPAYEWNFGDVNPPVHAWATIYTYRLELMRRGQGDIDWLERCFHKLLLNFTWWVNRKDSVGSNVFEGGFLGLDNIGVFDRSAPLPGGGRLEQADGTAWMALFCQNMIEISSILSAARPAYIEMALKFCEHFLWISSAMLTIGGGTGLWDETDGFFYDLLRRPDGSTERLKVRSMVGLLPLCAVTVFDGGVLASHQDILDRFTSFLSTRPELREFIHDPYQQGLQGRRLAAILNETKLRRVLTVMLDEREFLSPYGIRALSRVHAEHPYVFRADGQASQVGYEPAESRSGMFGGNSNWRGPVWMPVNVVIIRALMQYYMFYGDDFTIEYPTGSGQRSTLYQIAEDLARRLSSIFLRGADGRRPVFGGSRKFQEDPFWRDDLLFYEYFHGDNGAGLGASHQTGWTGVVGNLLHLFATTDAAQARTLGKFCAVVELSA